MCHVACHESCISSCSDDTAVSCDACAPGWQLAADGTGCQGKISHVVVQSSSSSRMRVRNHNWSATKQRLHPQSVVEISRHSVLTGHRIRQCGTSSGSRHKDKDHCKSPFPSAGTAVSLIRMKTVQQRPLLPREVETRLPDCGVTH